MTACANRHTMIRFGRAASTRLTTLSRRSRKMTSIGQGMPNVWMARQGARYTPSCGPGDVSRFQPASRLRKVVHRCKTRSLPGSCTAGTLPRPMNQVDGHGKSDDQKGAGKDEDHQWEE